jgi:hypothetical protein
MWEGVQFPLSVLPTAEIGTAHIGSLMTTSTRLPFNPVQLERDVLGDKRFQEILDLLEDGYSQVLSNEQYRRIAEIALKGIHC